MHKVYTHHKSVEDMALEEPYTFNDQLAAFDADLQKNHVFRQLSKLRRPDLDDQLPPPPKTLTMKHEQEEIEKERARHKRRK